MTRKQRRMLEDLADKRGLVRSYVIRGAEAVLNNLSKWQLMEAKDVSVLPAFGYSVAQLARKGVFTITNNKIKSNE